MSAGRPVLRAVGSPALACPICRGAVARWTEKRGHPILRCRSCGTAFVAPESVPDDLESLYSAGYFAGKEAAGYPGYLRDAALLERNFVRRLRWIESFRTPGRLLDVGAALGVFLKVARERGWDAVGVEIAPDCAREASRLAGVPVVAGSFPDVDLPGSFDVITMFDVIEHMRDPLVTFRGATKLLRPGGWLVIETGDLGSVYARLAGKHWHYLDPPQHLFYFTASALVSALRDCGLTGRVRSCRLGRWVSLSNGLFKLLRGQHSIVHRVPGSVYGNLWDCILLAVERE